MSLIIASLPCGPVTLTCDSICKCQSMMPGSEHVPNKCWLLLLIVVVFIFIKS
jgi:hypothetical protein